LRMRIDPEGAALVYLLWPVCLSTCQRRALPCALMIVDALSHSRVWRSDVASLGCSIEASGKFMNL
jgi:hypothetical protein